MDLSCVSSNMNTHNGNENIEKELYYLIAKFLSNGPCKKAYQVLKEEIEECEILPRRVDWVGNKHHQTFEEYGRQNLHITKDFLLHLVQRISPAIQQLLPSYPVTQKTLLGIGAQCLLRKEKDLQKSYKTAWSTVRRHSGNPILEPINLVSPPNVTHLLFGREVCGSVNRSQFLTNKFYSRFQLFARNVGHLSAVYCMLFDRHGRYIITGADDMLVKIWSIVDGRLVATLRGASAEICDLAIDYENTMVAAGSCDKVIRVWSLQTLAPIAVLTSHTGMITSLLFCPAPAKEGVLVSTGGDGCVSFWAYTRRGTDIKFDLKPLKMNERVRPGHAQLICASFSQGGSFLAIGGADHFVRVYFLGGPEGVEKLLEIETHQDRVDSIQWCHSGIGFASGSRNGTALIWRFECQQWKSMKLDMTQLLPGFVVPAEDTRKLQVTMVGWDRKDVHVVTASSDRLLRVWDSQTGQLKHILKGHEDNAYVIEAHPTDCRLILSAGHDGQLFIWDVFAGVTVKSFKNTIEGQGYGSLFDAKWTPDGFNIAATDSHGHILIFGIGHNDIFKKIPQELFFHTDYRPLVRDVNHHVLDEQTQLAPHLMPPPFLVNIDGDPYPPSFQRLVPGRENCREDQLVPNVVLNDNGEQEVLDVSGIEAFHSEALSNAVVPNAEENFLQSTQRLNIDDMIARLAHERNQRVPARSIGSEEEAVAGPSGLNSVLGDVRNVGLERRASTNGPYPDHSYAANNHDPLSPRAGRVGSRRVGDVEGIRQSTGNWQRDPNMKWKRRIFLKPLSSSVLQQSEEIRMYHGDLENRIYEAELCKKPESTLRPQALESSEKKLPVIKTKKKQKKQTHAYSTRASRGSPERRPAPPETEEHYSPAVSNHYDSSHSENPSDASDVEREDFDESSSSSDDQSTDYSDWTAEAGVNLEPPKRTAHRQKRSPVDVKSKRKSRSSGPEDKYDQFSDSRRKHRRRRKGGPQTSSEADGSIAVASTSRIRRDIKRINMAEMGDNASDEIPEEFRPPEWLSETVPKKAPYFPQMGDEIVYFRQGHQLYVEAVINRKLYSIDKRSLPWFRKHNLRDQEYVKIIGIKFEIKPPRLCCLKLGIMGGNDGSLGSDTFTIKYHDMEDVLDFLVLKQTYDNAVSRRWKPGDRFRCIIDDAWWFGEIEMQEPHLPEFPDSMFMCYRVVWDNGERERLSPWDLEPIDSHTKVPEHGGSVRVHPSEHQNLLYTINPDEWTGSHYETECQRIAEGTNKIMELAPAEPFLTPVDLNSYPNYAMVVEYPIDLSTIKSRLENHFYRRPTAIQFDVRYIATNAEKFNEKGSNIVKQARIITDLCLRLIKDRNCRDPTLLYHEIQSNYHSPNHSEDEMRRRPRRRRNHVIDSDDDRLESGRSRVRGYRDKASTSSAKPKVDSRPWQTQCRDLLRCIFERQDSAPFRYPVNLDQYQDYNQVIDVPMDLTTIREELSAGAYSTPLDFAKDMRIVFSNSKTYNTNKRSRIYSMTLRLEAYFEDQLKPIIARFKVQGKVLPRGISKRKKQQKESRQQPQEDAQGEALELQQAKWQRMNAHSYSKVASWLAQPVPRRPGKISVSSKVKKESPEAGPSSASNDVLTINLQMNGLLSDDDEDDSSGDDRSASVKGSTNEGGMRRSRRVARLKRLQANSDDSGEEYSPTPKFSKKKSISSPTKGSPSKPTKSNKGAPVKRSQGRRYEDDSDYEAPPPPRRNSSSSSTKTKKSRRYEDDSDFEGPPVSPVRMRPLDSDQDLDDDDDDDDATEREEDDHDEEEKQPVEEREQKDKTQKENADSNPGLKDEKDLAALTESEQPTYKTNGTHATGSKRCISSSGESDSEEYKPKLNGYHSKSSAQSSSVSSRRSSSSSVKSSPSTSSSSTTTKVHKSKKPPPRKKRLTSASDSESEEKPKQKKKSQMRTSNAEGRGGRRSAKDDSEFELDDEELEEESDDSEIEEENARKTRRGGIVSGLRRAKRAVLDGDDIDDRDFELDEDEDFIDDDEATSSESSDSEASDDSSESVKKKRPKKAKGKGAKTKKKKKKPNPKKGALHKKLKPKTKKAANPKIIVKKKLPKAKTNAQGAAAAKLSESSKKLASTQRRVPYQSITVSPETHTIKHVRHKGRVIGRVITPKDTTEEDILSEDYSETPLQSEEEEAEEAPLGVHSMVIGSFSKASLRRPSSLPSESYDDSGTSKRSLDREEEDYDSSEVGHRGRVRKRVRYAEEDSENEMASVSSRGRIRKANTRMRDFI